MPRKINYPGYQAGGPTPRPPSPIIIGDQENILADIIRDRVQREGVNSSGVPAVGGDTGHWWDIGKTPKRHERFESYRPPWLPPSLNARSTSSMRRDPGDVIYDIGREIDQWDLDNQYIPSERELEERFAPRPQWPTPSIPRTDLERIRDIGSGIAGKFRGGLEALGNRLRGHVRPLGRGPNLSTDPEYLERTSEVHDSIVDAHRRRLEGRASGGIIGLQQGGRSRFPDTVKGRARQARYDKKHGVPASQYGNTAASQNLSYLQQQQQRGSNMAANRVRPANTGVERNSQRKKREGQEQGQQQQQQGPPASGTRVTSYGVPQQTAQQWANLTDRIVGEGQRGYQQYGGQRIAGFTQPEAAAMAGRVAYGQGAGPAATQQAASTMGQAGQMLGSAYKGIGGLQPQYAQMAGQFGGAAQGALGQAQAGAQGMQDLSARAQLQGQLAGAGMRQTGTAAQAEQQALGAGQAAAGQAGQTQMTGLGQQMGTAGQAALGAQQGFGAGMTGMGTAAQQLGQTAMGQMGQTGQQSQQQAQQAAQRMRDIGGQAPQLQKGADMSDYMSQYTAGVTDPQLQQLLEFQKMQGQELGSQAAQQGAYGGSRMAVQAAEQAKAASQQAADIIGKGQQEAFQSAQQAFQADRAAQQQAQQTGLSAEQQAAATQAGAQGQALAAQQAGVGAAQTGSAQQMQAQQQAAQMADIGAGRQMQGIQGQGGLTAQGIGMGQQGLAAQQAAAAQGAQFGLQGQQQGFQAAQAGTQLGLAGLQQAGQLGQQGYGTMGQLMGQQQGAIGAQGQGFGQMGQLGGQMGQLGAGQMQLGAQEQQQQFERLRQMEAAGEKQRQMQQQSLGMGYQDWQNQMDQERKNIGWQQAAMSGLPYKGSVTESAYQPQTGSAANWIGTGLTALGAYSDFKNAQQQSATPQSSNAAWMNQPYQSQPMNPSLPVNTTQPIAAPTNIPQANFPVDPSIPSSIANPGPQTTPWTPAPVYTPPVPFAGETASQGPRPTAAAQSPVPQAQSPAPQYQEQGIDWQQQGGGEHQGPGEMFGGGSDPMSW